MNILTRLLLVVAAMAGLYSLAIVVALCWPASTWMLLIGGCFLIGRRGVVHLTTLGSARWATEREIKRAQMLDAKSGLILGKVKRRFGRDRLIRLSNGVHTAVYAPSGAGKGVSIVIPFLLTCTDSCFVVDFKGELALATAEVRKRMGHKIVVLDPYKVVTQ